MSTHSPETSGTTTHERQTEGPGRFDRGGTPAATTTSRSSGRATAALILGVLSIPLAILFAIVGLVLGIVAVVLGQMAKGDMARNVSNAKWGVILGAIGAVLAIANMVASAIILTS